MSNSVYKDLGFKNHNELKEKADIVTLIRKAFYRKMDMTVNELAEITKGNFHLHTKHDLYRILNLLEGRIV